MRKSPNLKENSKLIYNSKPSYLNTKTKQKTASLEKSSYTNRSLLHDISMQTPNQPKKNIVTQQSDQKLNAQNQILRSLMKIQSRTNPTNYQGVKLNFNNLTEDRKLQKTQSSTVHASPKTKATSLSTYTSNQSSEMRDKEIRLEKLQQFKSLLTQTKNCLETVRIQEMPNRIEQIFDATIQPLLKLKSDIMKQIDKCLNAEAYQIRSTIESLTKMEEDIKSNEFNIVEYMQMGPFNEIMGVYQKKFKEHTIFTQQLASQDSIITQLQQTHEAFSGQQQTLIKQLNQSLQAYLSLYISFQNKDDFFEQIQSRQSSYSTNVMNTNINQNNNIINISANNITDQLFQTCETNNSIDEDQVILKENQQTVRLPNKTSKFTQLFMQDKCCVNKQGQYASESPQFKN